MVSNVRPTTTVTECLIGRAQPLLKVVFAELKSRNEYVFVIVGKYPFFVGDLVELHLNVDGNVSWRTFTGLKSTTTS